MNNEWPSNSGDNGLETGNLAELATSVAQITDCNHVTFLAFQADGTLARRIYTTATQMFPDFGVKPVPRGRFSSNIIEGQNPVLSSGADEISAAFDDHEHILAQGIHAVLNIPVVRAGNCIGSVNCLYLSNSVPVDILRMARTAMVLLQDVAELKRGGP